jgi:hypothetical protein
MQKAGDALLEGYLTELFKFTIASYKTPSASIKYHASKLNHLWQRVLFESMALQVSCQNRLDDLINQIIQTYLDENLKQQAINFSSFNGGKADETDDDDENFEANQRTQKHDDFDWFSKLMRQKMEDSMQLLLRRYMDLIQ